MQRTSKIFPEEEILTCRSPDLQKLKAFRPFKQSFYNFIKESSSEGSYRGKGIEKPPLVPDAGQDVESS